MVKSMFLKLFLWLGLLISSEVFSFIGNDIFEIRYQSEYSLSCNVICAKIFILTLSKMVNGCAIEEDDFISKDLSLKDYNLMANDLLNQFLKENAIDRVSAKEIKNKLVSITNDKIKKFIFLSLRTYFPMPRLINGVPWQKYFIIKASRRFVGELKAIHPKFVVLTGADLVSFA